MSEEISLVRDLALILIAAGVFTIISKALKQPLILGYIVAGFLVGPHVGLFPNVTGTATVEQWSEIGIIFLLFALGLEFSFKKLIKVGSSAIIVAVCLCIGMFTLGFAVGNAVGWTTMESIFLGAMMSMSSTTIIIKAYGDLGIKDKSYSPLVFGTLVVEDLIAILMMVMLSTLAVSNRFAGGEMLAGLAKLSFFLILSFLVGIYVIPTLFKRFRPYLGDEILLLVSIGLCFGMVSLASYAGFSSALGAFLMGSILSESIEGERIEKLIGGIKDLFGAIFFVSVGMMIDPAVIVEHWGLILVLTIAAMGGIIVIGTFASIIAGNNLEDAVHTGFSLAQLGEFSFIIAGLGCSLGVVRDFIYPLIIAVSVITTFTTPYMIKAAAPVTRFLSEKLPPRILSRINSESVQQDSSSAEKNLWKSLIKNYLMRVLLYSVVLIAITALSKLYLTSLAARFIPENRSTLLGLFCVGVTLALMSPFLYGLSVTGGSMNKYSRKLLQVRDMNKWPILSLMILRIFLGLAFVISVIAMHFTLSGWVFLLIVSAGFVAFFSAKFSVHRFSSLEQHFMSNLNERELLEKKRKPVSSSLMSKMAGYDVHLELIEISPDYRNVGKALKDLPFRKDSGVNIIKISRGHKNIVIPSGDERIYPFDRILAVGTSEQIARFNDMIKADIVETEEVEKDFSVENATLARDAYLCGKTLSEVNMRSSGCVVLSVLRGDDFVTNPKPDFKFAAGDTVWMAGEKKSCDFFLS